MSAAAKLAAEYLAGAAALRAAVAGMSREQLVARPVAGTWSTLEVVAHIADFEPIIADRIKRMVATENATLLAADENLFAEKLRYHDRDLDDELAVVDAVRRSTARLIASLSDAELERTGTHSVRGPLTLRKVLELAVYHIPHHLPFIAAKRAALGV